MDRLSVELFDAGRLEADAGSARLVQGPKGDPGAGVCAERGRRRPVLDERRPGLKTPPRPT